MRFYHPASVAPPERRRVLDRLEGSAPGIFINLRGAGLGVLDRDPHLDVGQAGGEDPEAVVEGAAVHDLEEDLDVALVEEPEVAGVVRQQRALGGQRGGAWGGDELGRHPEAAVAQQYLFGGSGG